MPIARALLKDVKPPISDNAIADSLWHYWFDVEKAVAWLRRDWEKKGMFLSPSFTHHTPHRNWGVASWLCFRLSFLRTIYHHIIPPSDRIPAKLRL
jgi:hypothetical protein